MSGSSEQRSGAARRWLAGAALMLMLGTAGVGEAAAASAASVTCPATAQSPTCTNGGGMHTQGVRWQ